MDYISVDQACEQLGVTLSKLRHALNHGQLDGRKNGSQQWIYISAPSLERYQSLRHAVLPPGYITPEQAMELTGWAWEAITRRLYVETWQGIKGIRHGAPAWIGVLEADIRRDVRFRCKRCEILLMPEEPGPLCCWCATGGTDCAQRAVERPMAATVIRKRKVFPVEKGIDI